MQYGEGGERFCPYNVKGDGNNNLYFWYYEEVKEEAYGFNGKRFGLMSWNGGTAGKALMASSEKEGRLDAVALTVMTKTGDYGDKLFVPKDSDITDWTFRWVKDDIYQLTAVCEGSTKYLKVTGSGVYLVSEPDENCSFQLILGSGIHKGEIALKAGANLLCYSGNIETGFVSGKAAGSEWLRLT